MTEKELEPFKTLQEYADVMNDEYGETFNILIQLKGFSICLNDEFITALDKEIESHLKECQENAVVIERTVTRTYEDKTIEIEWD